jgi:hypothetical protein
MGRQRIVQPLRVSGVTADSCYADELVDLVVVRLEVVVADRPVFGHSVEGLHPKIRWQQPRPVGTVVDAGSADGIEHHRPHVGVLDVDWVVRWQPPHVRVVGPVVLDQ